MLAVTSAQRLGLKPVLDWLEDVPAAAWQRLSAGDGGEGAAALRLGLLPYRGAARGLAEGPAGPPHHARTTNWHSPST